MILGQTVLEIFEPLMDDDGQTKVNAYGRTPFDVLHENTEQLLAAAYHPDLRDNDIGVF